MFEKATRIKLRFATRKGTLSVEDLWDLSLADLNTLAKSLNKVLKESSEEDFLEVSSKVDVENKLKFDLALYILNTKKAEMDAKARERQVKEECDQLLEILSEKRSANLKNLSEEELLRRISELSNK